MLLQQKHIFIIFYHFIGTVFIKCIGVSSRGKMAALSSMISLHNSCLDITRMVSESEKRADHSNSLIFTPVTPMSLETDGFVPLVLPVVTKGRGLENAKACEHSVFILATQSFPL